MFILLKSKLVKKIVINKVIIIIYFKGNLLFILYNKNIKNIILNFQK